MLYVELCTFSAFTLLKEGERFKGNKKTQR